MTYWWIVATSFCKEEKGFLLHILGCFLSVYFLGWQPVCQVTENQQTISFCHFCLCFLALQYVFWFGFQLGISPPFEQMWNDKLCFTLYFRQSHAWSQWKSGSRRALPSEEFEVIANTLQAHMKAHGKLILKPLSYLTMHSRDDLTAVTFLWVLRELHLTQVSLLWPICEINQLAHHAVVSVSSLWSHC